MYVLLITGDRNWDNFETMFKAIKNLAKKHNNDVLIVNGDCVGADRMSTKVANILKLNLALFPANWSRYGKSAGPIRNSLMTICNPNECYAFHVNIDDSKGTKNMINTCIKKKIPVTLFDGNNSKMIKEEI